MHCTPLCELTFAYACTSETTRIEPRHGHMYSTHAPRCNIHSPSAMLPCVSISLYIQHDCHALAYSSCIQLRIQCIHRTGAHSGATLIKGNSRSAAPASGAVWPGRLPVSKHPGSVWRSVPALWLGWHRTLTIKVRSTGLHRDQVLRSRWCVFDGGFNLKTERRHSTSPSFFLSLCIILCEFGCLQLRSTCLRLEINNMKM